MLIPHTSGRRIYATVFAALLLTASALQAQNQVSLSLLERTIEPGEKQEFPFLIDRTFESSYVNMPVYVAHGLQAGHRLCVTAGIHGDEINGSEIARRAFAGIDPASLHGTVIMLPMINTAGIRNGERYMSDRRDLNRHFPGSYDGSIASIVARATFDLVTTHCDTLIDLHTGSFLRANAPQIRVTRKNPEALTLARNFGSGIIIFGDGPRGSMRREAFEAGLTAIIYEAAGPHVFDVEAADVGVRGLMNVMNHLEMLPGDSPEIPDNQVYRRTTWVRTPLGAGGYFFPEVTLGAKVSTGQRLGHLVSPLDNETTVVNATQDGTIIGMARPQIVLSGYALFHLGLEGQSGELTEKELREQETADALTDG
jgi:predicted deacylase